MDYYRCENPDCGYLAEEEPDVCPRCGAMACRHELGKSEVVEVIINEKYLR